MRHALIGASLLLFVACGNNAGTPLEPAPEPMPASETSQTDSEMSLPTPVAPGTLILDAGADVSAFTVPEGLDVSLTEDGHIAISGTDAEKASTGMTSGAYLTIDATGEALASGNTILVQVTGKAESGETAIIDVAFSTAEVGNSGWKALTFGSDVSTQSFRYNVPEMNEGRMDFLGFSPNEGTVNIASVRVVTE